MTSKSPFEQLKISFLADDKLSLYPYQKYVSDPAYTGDIKTEYSRRFLRMMYMAAQTIFAPSEEEKPKMPAIQLPLFETNAADMTRSTAVSFKDFVKEYEPLNAHLDYVRKEMDHERNSKMVGYLDYPVQLIKPDLYFGLQLGSSIKPRQFAHHLIKFSDMRNDETPTNVMLCALGHYLAHKFNKRDHYTLNNQSYAEKSHPSWSHLRSTPHLKI